MYTRRSRVPFARVGVPAAAVAMLLAGCHSAPNAPSHPAPAPESVQVGYGAQDRRDVTAAVNSASGEKLRRNSPRTAADMLVGRFPGVEVRQQANGTPSIRIRGSRSFRSSEEPLIVVDGIPQANGGQALMDLSPQDVHSIDVLKDAAATSVFGSRGANGVILIATRRSM